MGGRATDTRGRRHAAMMPAPRQRVNCDMRKHIYESDDRRYNRRGAPGTPALHNPLYRHVISRMTEKLESGEWRANQTIPSEWRLAEQFRVSIGTIRRAVDELVAGRILVRHQGRGTFVAAHTEDHYRYHFFRLVDAQVSRVFPAVQLQGFRRGRAGDAEAARLEVKRGAAVIRIINLLRLENEPVVLDRITLPAALFPGLTRAMFAGRTGTIYHLYQERFGVSIIRAVERLRAAAADRAAARALGVRADQPLLEIERLAYTYRNRPVELRVSHAHTARHSYLSEIGKSDA